MAGEIWSDPFRGASNLAGRSNVRTTEATKYYPRVKRIAGMLGVPSRSPIGEGLCRRRCLELIDVELPGVGEDGMSGRNGQRKLGSTRGSPRRSRTAKASRLSCHAVKSRCAREWGGWGRLSEDGPGQHNPDPSEGPWGGGRPTLHGGALSVGGPTLSGISTGHEVHEGWRQTRCCDAHVGSRLKRSDTWEGAI